MGTYKVHPAKANPDSWKWRLVLWLTGGTIEVVPLLPQRPIYRSETLTVRLGWEGAFNTVEVKTMVNETTELLKIDEPLSMMMPNTFVALDTEWPDDAGGPGHNERIVGTFVSWIRSEIYGADTMLIERPGHDSRNVVEVPIGVVTAAYWAPMGYRA